MIIVHNYVLEKVEQIYCNIVQSVYKTTKTGAQTFIIDKKTIEMSI